MAQWKVTLDDGSVHVVEADNQQEAGQKALDEAKGLQPVTAKGLGAEGLAALGRGTAYAAGLPGTISDIASRGMQAGLRKLGVETKPSPDVAKKLERFGVTDRNPFSSAALTKKLSELTGGFTDRPPHNVPEEYVRSGMEFGPTGALFGGPSGFVTQGVLPGMVSETAGQLARRYLPNDRPAWMPDWVPDKETSARIIGALGSPIAMKALTPHPMLPGRVRAAQVLKDEGIDFTAGQKTGASRLRYAEANTGRYADELQNRQAEQFTAAALKRIGVTAPRATDEVMAGAETRIGNMFDSLANRYDIQPTTKFGYDLHNARNWYNSHVGLNARQPIVSELISDIAHDVNSTGTITGRQYQSYVSRIRSHITPGDPAELKLTLVKIRNALDDAMESSIQKQNPNDVGAWRVARNNYRNYLAIQDTLLPGAGPQAAEGLISPHQLASAVARYGGKRGYVQNTTDMAELAKAGKVLLQKLPQSGTASHGRAMLGPALAVGGAGAGYQVGSMLGPVGGALGTLAGAVAPAVGMAAHDATLMSKPVQKYLGMQLLPRSTQSQKLGGLLRLLGLEEQVRGSHQGGGSNAP